MFSLLVTSLICIPVVLILLVLYIVLGKTRNSGNTLTSVATTQNILLTEVLNLREKHQDGIRINLQETQALLERALQQVQQNLQMGLSTQQNFTQHLLQNFSQNTEKAIQSLSDKVEGKLSEGMERTLTTFQRITERLLLIDEAQKRMSDLSSQVVSLQEILTDKRARGAFGEIQLEGLLKNMLPPNAFALQHTLANRCRADAMLYLPEPTGNIAIDAKFPLESYRKLQNKHASEIARKEATLQFKQDIKKHIQDIKQKYISPPETTDSAILFLPAEAIFSYLHSEHGDLIDFAHKERVWLTSPTTLMALLTTARAVIKDARSREEMIILQKHLSALAQDFNRFEKRMDQLSRHIEQAHQDVHAVQQSAQKITRRFTQLEQLETAPAAQNPTIPLPTLEE